MDGIIYDAYVNILKEELVPAMGCTEPIAIAYAAQWQGKLLGVCQNLCESAPAAILLKM